MIHPLNCMFSGHLIHIKLRLSKSVSLSLENNADDVTKHEARNVICSYVSTVKNEISFLKKLSIQ